MSIRRSLLISAALLFVVTTGCGDSPSEEDGGTDAGIGEDAGAMDAGGMDAGEDGGGIDAGTDAGGTDGGFDAGFDAGFDGGFDAGFDGGFDGGTDAGGSCTPVPDFGVGGCATGAVVCSSGACWQEPGPIMAGGCLNAGCTSPCTDNAECVCQATAAGATNPSAATCDLTTNTCDLTGTGLGAPFICT